MKNKKADFNYFEYFCTCGEFACSAADSLLSTLTDYNPKTLKERVDKIHEIENKADAAKHDMTEHLTKEFITPIEREDIVALAQEMDNVIDAIDEVLQRAYMFNIDKPREEVIPFAELIVKCTKALNDTLKSLESFKKHSNDITKNIVEVNTLESTGDAMHSANIRKLFTDNTDARDLFVWNIMFECMENCLDACEHAADIVESVIMKNT